MELENEHVHRVYDHIASHFSQTRHRRWPVVEIFLNNLPPHSLVGDIGCGNGKNMMAVECNYLQFIGADYCPNLVKICAESQPHAETMIADNLHLPYRNRCFDHMISIAVIHHFSSGQRRVQALRELIRCVRSGGKILIFVWALEQSESSKRRFTEQEDIFVPWFDGTTKKTYQRFYHLFVQGELERLCRDAAAAEGRSIEFEQSSGYDRDNWYCLFTTI
jgi:tRNA (uracil-5-)-methyltransferase TRM9